MCVCVCLSLSAGCVSDDGVFVARVVTGRADAKRQPAADGTIAPTIASISVLLSSLFLSAVVL